MSVKQIPNLGAISTLSSSTLFEGVQAGVSVKVSALQIGQYVATTYPTSTISSVTANSPLTSTTVSGAVTINLPSQSITNAYLATMAAGTIKANLTAGTAVPSNVTPSAVLDTFGTTTGSLLYRGVTNWQALTAGTNGQILNSTGATSAPQWSSLSTLIDSTVGGGTQGGILYRNATSWVQLAPGTSGSFLQTQGAAANPIWASAGTGTVTSVSFTGGIITVADSTTTPSLTIAGTSGGIPYFSSTSAWASSAVLAANALMIGGGAGAAPSTTTTGTGVLTALAINTGTAGSFIINGGALGTPLSGTLTNATGLPLTTGVTGILPVANGGTGSSSPSLIAGTNISITGTWPNQTINATGGGSGTVNSGTSGQLTYYAATGTAVSGNANATISAGALTLGVAGTAAGSLLLSGSTSGAVTVQSAAAAGTWTLTLPTTAGTNGYVLSTNGAGVTSWIATSGGGGTVTSIDVSGGSTGLTTSGGPVTGSGTITLGGTLAIGYGGTGQTTASAAFNALSPITAAGDLILGNGTNSATRLAIGANTYVLTSNGTTASWQPAAGGGSGTVNSGTAGQMTYYASTGTAVSGNANATISGGALTLGVAGTAAGSLLLSGSTSGAVTVKSAAAAGTWALTLPTTAGTNGYVLSTDGTGITSWIAAGGSMVYPSAGIAVSTGSAWGTSIGTPIIGTYGGTGVNNGANTLTLSGNNSFNQAIYTNAAVTVSANAGTVPVTQKLNTFTNSSAAAMTITLATASAVDGQMSMVRIYDASAAAQTINWVNTENSNVTAPTTSNGSTTLPLTVGFMYNAQTSKWRCIASA